MNPKHWIIFNTQRTGFYRVNYDKQNWKLITDYLNSTNLEKIHILNRVQLIDDANALAQNQLLDLQTLLHLTTYLRNEKDYIAWYPAFETFSWLKTKLINTDYYPNFKKYVLDKMEHLIEAIDWKQIQDDKYLTEFNRISIIKWACSMGHTSCMISMHEKMQKWLEGTERGLDAMKINTFEKPSSPDPIESVKQIILCQGLQLASVDEWRMMLKKYNGSESQYERDILGSTLGCTTDSRILRYNLDYAIKNHLPFNDTLKIVTSIYRNSEEGISYVLDFFQENVRSLMKANNDDLFNVIEDIGRRITNINQLSQLRMVSQHIRYNETSKAIHTMDEAIHNIEWLEKNKETLQLFFGSKSKMI